MRLVRSWSNNIDILLQLSNTSKQLQNELIDFEVMFGLINQNYRYSN